MSTSHFLRGQTAMTHDQPTMRKDVLPNYDATGIIVEIQDKCSMIRLAALFHRQGPANNAAMARRLPGSSAADESGSTTCGFHASN